MEAGCQCLIIAIIIIVSIISNSSKSKSDSVDSSNVNLDDIFNDIVKNTNSKLSSSRRTSLPSPETSGQPVQRQFQRKKNKASLPPPPRVSLTSPTVHSAHDCEEVNYDNLGSLEGGIGSFNLSEPEETVATYKEQSKISIGREDLLKSFVMSEVLQRYDINRIYSRIPSVKSDE